MNLSARSLLSSRVFLFACALGNVAALWCGRVLPFTDVPQHAATIAGLRDALLGRSDLYELVLARTQYLLCYLLGAGLSLVTTPERAVTVLLSGAALGLPFALRALAREAGADERVALFAVPLFWCQSLVMGFLNYVLALPVLLWALALVFAQAREPSRSRAWGLAALGVTLYLLHLSALVFFLPVAGLLLALSPRWDVRGLPSRLPNLFCLVPTSLLCVFWLLSSNVSRAAGESELKAGFTPLGRAIRLIPSSLTDIWGGAWDGALLALLGGALLLAAFANRTELSEDSRLTRRWATGLVAFAVLLYFAMPFSVGWLFVLNQRYAILAALLAPLLLRGAGRRFDAAFALVAFVAIASSVLAASRIRAFQAEVAGAERVLAQVPAGAKLISLVPESDSASTVSGFFPLHHLAALARARQGCIVEPSFLQLGQSPLHYRAESAPPPKPLFWEWTNEDTPSDADARYFDFLFAARSAWPVVDAKGWRQVATDGAWRLYARP